MAAEFVGDALEALLRAKFDKEQAPKEIVEKLVGDFLAPLGTLAMKAKACRAFGLITDDTYEAIDRIRDIRNACGHRKGPIALQDSDLAEFVRWLAKFLKRYPAKHEDGRLEYGLPWWKDLGTDVSAYSAERMTFMDAVCILTLHLQAHEYYLQTDRQFVPTPINPTPPDQPMTGPGDTQPA